MSIRFLVESHYVQVRKDLDYWENPITEALKAARLWSGPLQVFSYPSSNVVFAMGNDHVVKVYAPFFRGRETEGMEREAHRMIAKNHPRFPVAKVVGTTFLEPESSDWKWPVIVFSRVPGFSVEVLSSGWAEERWLAFASESGKLLAELHGIAPTQEIGEVYRNLNPGNFVGFLETQLKLKMNSQELKGLAWFRELEKLSMPQLAKGWPCLVHGDLVASHWILGDDKLSLIDFDDSKMGDKVWDFYAVSQLLGQNPERLRAFETGYGKATFSAPNLHQKLGAYALLNEWVTTEEIYRWYTRSGASTLEGLGKWLWPS